MFGFNVKFETILRSNARTHKRDDAICSYKKICLLFSCGFLFFFDGCKRLNRLGMLKEGVIHSENSLLIHSITSIRKRKSL